MRKNGIDKRARIGTGENQTHLSDHTMNNIGTSLLQLIRIDRELGDVAMLELFLRHLPHGGRVDKTVGVHAFVTVLKQSVSDDIVGAVVLVIPNKRNRFTIAIGESVMTNDSTVRALNVVTSGPASKIRLSLLHFDYFPPVLLSELAVQYPEQVR